MNRRTLLSASIGPASLAAIGPASLASISAAVPSAPHDPDVAQRVVMGLSCPPEDAAGVIQWILKEGPERAWRREVSIAAAIRQIPASSDDLYERAERFLRVIDTGSAA